MTDEFDSVALGSRVTVGQEHSVRRIRDISESAAVELEAKFRRVREMAEPDADARVPTRYRSPRVSVDREQHAPPPLAVSLALADSEVIGRAIAIVPLAETAVPAASTAVAVTGKLPGAA
jgi:hypothetical protein